jgi:hypothetical protein
MLAVLGIGAGLSMGAVAVASELEQRGAEVVVSNDPVDVAQPTANYGETVTQTTAPTAIQTTLATPPVTAEPAPTEEPG